jgi:hypothetical protein
MSINSSPAVRASLKKVVYPTRPAGAEPLSSTSPRRCGGEGRRFSPGGTRRRGRRLLRGEPRLFRLQQLDQLDLEPIDELRRLELARSRSMMRSGSFATFSTSR